MESNTQHTPVHSSVHISSDQVIISGVHGGALGVDISSAQPGADIPAALHLHQVPENMRSVGSEPKSSPLPKAEVVLEAEAPTSVSQPKVLPPVAAHLFDSSQHNPKAPDEEFWKDGPKVEEGVLGHVMTKASEIFGEVKERAVESLGDLKEKASGAWHAVAGVVGAAPGKELKDDQSERVVAGGVMVAAAPLRGEELGVTINSHQPPVNSAAGLHLHGDVHTGESDKKRATVLVGEDSKKVHSS